MEWLRHETFQPSGGKGSFFTHLFPPYKTNAASHSLGPIQNLTESKLF
jgi:hypothetical protein